VEPVGDLVERRSDTVNRPGLLTKTLSIIRVAVRNAVHSRCVAEPE
jgi:hypothetical protein